MKYTQSHAFLTAGGIRVTRASIGVDYPDAASDLIDALDDSKGALFSSSFEYPGRYTRWDLGFVNPPLCLSARDRCIRIDALNARGELLLRLCHTLVSSETDYESVAFTGDALAFNVRDAEPVLIEEQRTRQRSVFTFLRKLLACFASPDDDYLGLYGAFGYELAFQFEAVRMRIPRDANARDLVLYLPDTILVVDHKRETAQYQYYDFAFDLGGAPLSTRHLPRSGTPDGFKPPCTTLQRRSDHAPGAYAESVRKALQYFDRGDLFEAVPGQTFYSPCQDSPACIFRRLQQQNPAPYGALLNLGGEEYLVAASPEMFVRVDGRRVETCPISGTIPRGADALEDAVQIRSLLNSAKDEAELSMCTDVDRNDKARVCEPGSIKVLGRRQLELYSRLIHTVDHVEGRLKPQFDALDAFLSHAWAVTVTGAPKQAAIQFIEDHEVSPRGWYGGAIGCLNFNGNLNTGLTIRTMRIREGIAEVRAGATLLADSDPEAEEAETMLKASALLQALEAPPRVTERPAVNPAQAGAVQHELRVLMVDHQDSFVHTLSSYFQETGAVATTVRPEHVDLMLRTYSPHLVILSPGPGRPADFQLECTLRLCLARALPVFGVCLGLQGIVEYYGGTLATLTAPVHGKASPLVDTEGFLFTGLAQPVRVGRYHSLVAATVPDCLRVCARSADGHVMAVQHRTLPVAAVQFHPESILSMDGDNGRAMIRNVVAWLPAMADAPRAGHALRDCDIRKDRAVS